MREPKMSDNPKIDPALQSLEARLTAMVPRLPPGVHKQLLYECAFAAGRAAGQRASRHVIRASTAVTLVLALLSVSLPYRAAVHPEAAPLAHTSQSHNILEAERDRS